MEAPYEVEIEPEVRAWLDSLPREHYRAVERHADRLAAAPTTLGEPHARHLQVLCANCASTWAEQIEGGGASPTLPLLRQLAAALDAQLDMSIGADEMSLAFARHAA
ncbi:hypothetical protein ACGFSB_03785 [Streptomyces sp. NPDC048441]|uniref:hypothetical protein n=1 Tax=Streptomyces sp. NPDC048441 TaxID=3365552 RepID=UPI00371B4818